MVRWIEAGEFEMERGGKREKEEWRMVRRKVREIIKREGGCKQGAGKEDY